MPKSPPPDTKAFMIATGEFRRMAELTAPRVERFAGLPVEVITEGDPFELKLCLLERTDSSVFFVDADAVMVGWDWSEFQLPGVNACYEQISKAWPGYAHLEKLFDPAVSVNTGMFLVSADNRELFKRAVAAKKKLEKKKFPYILGDQTPLNVALSESKNLRLNMLPQKYNWQVFGDVPQTLPEGVLLYHMIGGTLSNPDFEKKLSRVAVVHRRFPTGVS